MGCSFSNVSTHVSHHHHVHQYQRERHDQYQRERHDQYQREVSLPARSPPRPIPTHPWLDHALVRYRDDLREMGVEPDHVSTRYHRARRSGQLTHRHGSFTWLTIRFLGRLPSVSQGSTETLPLSQPQDDAANLPPHWR